MPTSFKIFAKGMSCLLFSLVNIASLRAQTTAISFSNLVQGQKVNGFSATSVYLNDAGQPMGGRFVHDRTHFTLDLLQIESVPQTFIWVNTFPVSDKGEPHTQEHLLITKGNKGHELNTREGMSLAASNAFTSQLHTAYDFYTGAGVKVFYKLFEEYMDALLHPDYTSEEVHREVRNWGVSENPDKSLKIEEKGSVYNEMSTSMTNPFAQMYDKMGRLLYGQAHPLSFNAGGLPAAIRELGASQIQSFHDANYHLWNMGAITSLPKNIALADILSETNNILNRLEPNPILPPGQSAPKLPSPQPAAEGKIEMAEYPGKNEQEAGNMMFVFPAVLTLNATEELLLGNFLYIFAGDASTNLYKKFIDSKTREIDLGAQSLFGYLDDNPGQPVFIGINDIAAENLTVAKAEMVRQKISGELARIAAFPDNSPELTAFNNRFKNSLTDTKRNLAKFVNTPPKFGFRNTYDSWYSQLDEMTKIKDFRKSIILKPQFDEIEKMLATGKNFWRDYLAKWKLTSSKPFGVVSKANAALIDKNEADRKERVAGELSILKNKYHVSDDQVAIQQYKNEYDSNTTELEKIEKSHAITFIDHPPLTLDEELDFKTVDLPGKIKMVASTFNNMTSATTGIAFRLDGVKEDELVYLSVLPQLLRETGVIKDGKAINYDDMSELLRQEILSLQCIYSVNPYTNRVELLVKGAGNNAEEAGRAIYWMNLILQHPNWTKENLSRIRDLVDQNLASLRKTMQQPEEAWVNDPKEAYRAQENPLLLSTFSFLTRAHHVFRLKWMLKEAGDATNKTAIDGFLKKMSALTGNRENLKNLLAAMQSDSSKAAIDTGFDATLATFKQLPSTAMQLAVDASKDLEQLLNDIPDNSLTPDWAYLCGQMAKDLSKGPDQTMAGLEVMRKSILKKSAARMFMIASGATRQKLSGDITMLIGGLDDAPASKASYSKSRLVDDRVKARLATTEKPVFVGLMNPNSQTGVFMNAAKLTSYKDTSREDLLRFLAAGLYGGGGKQSVYTKTTGAGLSYSTGVGTSPAVGLFTYYAERTPELPQTLRFVIDEIKRSPVDTSLGEYVIAGAFRAIRAANDYESRGEAMAGDLADGYTPELVRNFRTAIQNLRKMPNLVGELYKRKDLVYEKILPGYGVQSKEVEGGSFYVIGAEKQMTAYEAYLRSVYGKDINLYRIYPRDYWIVGK